ESCFAFVVLTNGSPQSGVQGVQFGVTYDGSPGAGVDVFGWSACAAGQITTGGWPAPGAGINLIWNSCHVEEPHGTGHGVAVVAGYFYLSAYSPDRLELTNAESQHGLPITDCNQVQTSGFDSAPPRRGHAVFSPAGDQSGWNPCTPTPLTTGSCHVDGPRLIPPGSVGAVYTITDPIPGVEYHWFTSSGTLRITGPSVGNSITVDAPEIGGEQLIVSSMATSPISYPSSGRAGAPSSGSGRRQWARHPGRDECWCQGTPAPTPRGPAPRQPLDRTAIHRRLSLPWKSRSGAPGC
ncbi:MAG: hypothetical protein FD129_1397, partial [bacterium]